MGTRVFLGHSAAAGGDPRRSGTAFHPVATPASKVAASAFSKEHEGPKPAIYGCGTRGSEGARRAALRWQRGGQRRRAAARSKRLRKEHAPAHLLRRQQRVLERERGLRATRKPPSAATAVAKVALTAEVAAETAAETAAMMVAVVAVVACGVNGGGGDTTIKVGGENCTRGGTAGGCARGGQQSISKRGVGGRRLSRAR